MADPHDVVSRRRVFVLGANPSVQVRELFADAADAGEEVLFLSVGYPVTPSQQRVVASATEAALDFRVRFAAVLVAGPALVAAHLLEGDDVSVLASGWRRWRLEAAIKPKI